MSKLISLLRCQGIARMIEPSFNNINVHSKDWTYYRTMTAFLFGTLNGIHDPKIIHSRTNIRYWIIAKACENLKKNGIWVNGETHADIFDEKEGWMEIILCTMCAMGQIQRIEVKDEEFTPRAFIPENVFASRYDYQGSLLRELHQILHRKKSVQYYAEKLNTTPEEILQAKQLLRT